MRRRNDKSDQIIIKRRSKRGHEEAKTGAWKVAFADFTLAMMALFMVLWIVQPQADGDRLGQSGGPHIPLSDGGAGVFDSVSQEPMDYGAQPKFVPFRQRHQESLSSGALDREVERYDSEEQLRGLAQLMERLAERVDALANIEVHVVPQGLRILIKDDAQRFMFERGSARLHPHFRQLLTALGSELLKVENKLIISGHTDATPYRGKGSYDNWDLSGERALQARTVLMAAGLSGAGILQVSAQADVMPLRAEDPFSGVNRRIELLLLTGHAEDLYRQLFSKDYVRYSGTSTEYVAPVVSHTDNEMLKPL